jgi:hypothetical protein
MTNNDLTKFITYSTAIAGFICLVVGLAMLVADYYLKYRTATKAKEAVDAAQPRIADGQLQEQGAVSGALDSVAKLAAALKDLDTGARVLVLSVAFFAVAAVAAGADAVAGAIGA